MRKMFVLALLALSGLAQAHEFSIVRLENVQLVDVVNRGQICAPMPGGPCGDPTDSTLTLRVTMQSGCFSVWGEPVVSAAVKDGKLEVAVWAFATRRHAICSMALRKHDFQFFTGLGAFSADDIVIKTPRLSNTAPAGHDVAVFQVKNGRVLAVLPTDEGAQVQVQTGLPDGCHSFHAEPRLASGESQQGETELRLWAVGVHHIRRACRAMPVSRILTAIVEGDVTADDLSLTFPTISGR